MVGGRLGESIGIREETIKKACHLAFKAHRSSDKNVKNYLCDKSRSSPEAIFAFAGFWSVDEWFTSGPFGETEINLKMFPSLRSIGNDEAAAVNGAFLRRFETIMEKSSLANETQKAVSDGKKVVFVGHSSGGSMAILATLWFLEKYMGRYANQIPPLCVTFGSPLIGDHIFSHALKRETWIRYFVHFVMRYDIVPRIMLTPLSSVEQVLQQMLHFFNPKSWSFESESIGKSSEASVFFMNVMRNASAAASQAACHLMGCTNSLLETVSSFIELSPYKPFGTYIFCTGNGRLIVLKNSDAVLQLLFYSMQLNGEAYSPEIAHRCLKEHLVYEIKLQESLEMQNVINLDHLEELPLSSDVSASVEVSTTNMALDDLGLSTRAKLCLRAAGELQKQKEKNQAKIDSKKINIENGINKIQEYQTGCELRKVGYYDAFKLQKDVKDFDANVKRLELAGIWDEIIEMLRRYELPDEFEGRKEWIEIGTRFRRLVEPLDIANYYRHLKNEDTGPYLKKARPKRYRYTQRWREHAEKMPVGSSSESCFWAEVEELKGKSFEEIKQKISNMEMDVSKWVQKGELGKDVFLDGSTFTNWRSTLPPQHRSESCLASVYEQLG